MLTLSRAMLEGVPTDAPGVEVVAPAGAGTVASKAAMTLTASTDVSNFERMVRGHRRSRRRMFIAHLPGDRDHLFLENLSLDPNSFIGSSSDFEGAAHVEQQGAGVQP
jgi:hypothetical protein